MRRIPIENLWVIPRKETVSNKGTIWEGQLYEKGWNDLTRENKPGKLLYGYYIHNFLAVSIYWPALELTLHNIFVDEIYEIDKGVN